MKLTYTKITKTKYKFFYQEGEHYGEFYIEITPKDEHGGSAEIISKDPDYSQDLIIAFTKAMLKGGE